MTDRKIMDEWPGEDPQGGKDGWRRGNARGLHLQQIVEPGEEEVYSGVGTELQAERQRQKLSLADIASTLRIQLAHLQALEEGRTDALPGPTYAIGFLRTYSEFLNLDGDEIIRQFKREATLVPVERRLVIPEPLDEARRPGLRLALVSLLVAGAVYGGWIFLEQQGLVPIEAVAEPPQRLAPYQAAQDTTESAKSANIADAVPAPPPREPVADPAVGKDMAAATPNIGPVANTADTWAGEPQANVPDVPGAQVDAEAPAVPSGVTDGAPADVTAEIAPQQPKQPAAPPIDAGTVGQVAMTAKPDPDGDRSAADVDTGGPASTAETPASTAETPAATAMTETGVSIGDMPPSANLAATVNNPLSPVSPDAVGQARQPLPKDRMVPATTTEDAAQSQPAAPQPDAPQSAAPQPDAVSQGDGNLEAAPVMPAVQAAIDPPPPPAAPSTSTRILPEKAGEDASDGDTTGTFMPAATDGLGNRPQAYGASNRNVRVVLRARAESWVQVQGANNELLLTRMLRAGDSYHAPNRDDLILMTGNAGAIEIIVDGEPLGALGPVGQVRRNIRLNAEFLQMEMGTNTDSSP